MNLKQKIYNHYLQIINSRVVSLKKTLADLKESGANETKSTAGDKHETTLAMLQIEQANTRAQLQNALDEFAVLQNIKPALVFEKIIIGSLVKTNKGYFFMSVALGKSLVNDILVFALSPQSPLGAKLMGLGIGDKTSINGNEYLVEMIL